jgi:hypothetical protein
MIKIDLNIAILSGIQDELLLSNLVSFDAFNKESQLLFQEEFVISEVLLLHELDSVFSFYIKF